MFRLHCCQVLSSSGASHPPLRQRIMCPLENRHGARLEGFHIRCAYRMAKQEHKPKRGPDRVWIYPSSEEDVLKECEMKTMGEYILIRRQTVAVYVGTRPILDECKRSEQKRGAIPRQWWWEQPMDLEVDATGSED
jgi:hypothetical protein